MHFLPPQRAALWQRGRRGSELSPISFVRIIDHSFAPGNDDLYRAAVERNILAVAREERRKEKGKRINE